MAKKARKPKARTDADRRARQCERLSRHLRVLHCIMGSGRWDAESLASELECSTRTVHRMLQTLSMAGVPWHFCKDSQCYRVRPGFRFPGIDRKPRSDEHELDASAILDSAQQLLEDGERFMESLRHFYEALQTDSTEGDKSP